MKNISSPQRNCLTTECSEPRQIESHIIPLIFRYESKEIETSNKRHILPISAAISHIWIAQLPVFDINRNSTLDVSYNWHSLSGACQRCRHSAWRRQVVLTISDDIALAIGMRPAS
ncbi:hypothetical protein TNCV_94361 [Trichonephila clavipes]|nr:hypothetical protein TNCV_94361 [Trichonephila clavipes]